MATRPSGHRRFLSPRGDIIILIVVSVACIYSSSIKYAMHTCPRIRFSFTEPVEGTISAAPACSVV